MTAVSDSGTSSGSVKRSFRDPAGSLFKFEGRVFRAVAPEAWTAVEGFLNSGAGKRFIEDDRVVQSVRADNDDPVVRSAAEWIGQHCRAPFVLIEHERIPFPSYAYEWPIEMLREAALLTLDLAEAALQQGYGLKDGTPYNVLFRGPHPVFVDTLSFETRDGRDPLWLPYAQFLRTFVFPMMLERYRGVPVGNIMALRREGPEPEEVYEWLGIGGRIRPTSLFSVTLPVWLSKLRRANNASLYQAKRYDDPDKARFVLEKLFGRLRVLVHRLGSSARSRSTWSEYMTDNHTGTHTYSDEQLRSKMDFVQAVVADLEPATALDIGCNTGLFSALVARTGTNVVAIDYDPVVIGSTWELCRSENLPILPLVVDLSRPTPATGWRNGEYASFIERATGAFDMVLILAVIHHLAVTERVPLAEIIDLASDLTRKHVIIEFVGPNDAMFRRLLRGRDHLYSDYNQQAFEAECLRHFAIERKTQFDRGDRCLYLLKKMG